MSRRSLTWKVVAGAVGASIVALASVMLLATPPDRPVPAPVQVPAQTGALQSVDHWRELFDERVALSDADSDGLSRSSDSYDFYDLAYSIDQQANMFQAVGDVAYARQGLRYAMNMIGSARPSSSLETSSYQDKYLGWVSAQNGGDETPLYESYVWRYVTRLLRLIQPTLAGAPPDVAQDYATVLAFTETDIVDKWVSRGVDENIYRSRTHMAAHWASIALDVSRLTRDDARREQCLEIVRNIDRHLPNYPSSLHAQMGPHPGDPRAYWWSDTWGSEKRPGQDISHGNGVIAYVVEARDLGGDWSEDDVRRLCRTLTEFVLGTGDSHPAFVDGTGDGNGWIADGWVKLGRYDPRVQAALESYPVQNTQYYSAMAVNARLLADDAK